MDHPASCRSCLASLFLNVVIIFRLRAGLDRGIDRIMTAYIPPSFGYKAQWYRLAEFKFAALQAPICTN